MKIRPFSLINTVLILLFCQFGFSQKTLPDDQLIGKGNPDFIERDGYKLRPEAAKAFDEMKAAAAKDGIAFQVVSSYRDYAHQNRIWERKYNAYTKDGLSPMEAIEKIITYSTIPGTSRHHWGTDIDIVDSNVNASGDVLVPSKFHGNGPFCKFKAWMDTHANTYGYYLVYTDNGNRKGFNYEPWHYSYKPLSLGYLEQYKKLDVKKVLEEQKLLGSDQFSIEFITRYRTGNILDINPELLP